MNPEIPPARRFVVFLLALGWLLGAPLSAQSTPPTGTEMPLTTEARSQSLDSLEPRYLKWLQSVRGLMTQPELDYFLRLREDFRRDAFMRAFWVPRDPNPRTARNELKERWEKYRDNPGGVPYGDPRFLLLLFNGPPGGWSLPDGRPVARCFSRNRELEIWFYGASERTDQEFPVIVLRRGPEVPYEVFQPGGTLRAMQRGGGLPTQDIRQLCADDLLRYTLNEISRVTNYDRLLRDVLAPHLPSSEWLANLASSETDLPRTAEVFEVEATIGFPVRKQSRTAVEVMIAMANSETSGKRFDDVLHHNVQLVGEIIRDGKLFESFRYRFEGPTPEQAVTIPFGFTRFLRPGTVELRILLENLYDGKYARIVRQLEIPSPDGLPALPATNEASEIALGPSIELVPPAGSVHVGQLRFRARTTGQLDKVTFYVDDKPRMSKRRPPYSVELDLGPNPEPKRIRAVGFVEDREVATDQLWLNQGGQRFRVNLIEPRSGGIYPGSFTARVRVDTPDGGAPERVELFLGDEQIAVLADAPYAQSMRLPDGANSAAVVRAVAYLADGSSSEDTVIVNGSPFSETVEVRLVETAIAVRDRDGRPIDVTRDQVAVFAAGTPQTVERFESMRDAPISVALLIDRSISMEPHLPQVTAAAGTFLQAALTKPEDRAAIFSFADSLKVEVDFTSQASSLERALAGLDARGGTALYDGLAQAFNTLSGGSSAGGLDVMVLFTDGQDEASRLTFEQALEAARRSGMLLYGVALAEAFPDKASRRVVEQLVQESGGQAHFVAGLDELQGVYMAILEDLRSRYLVAFQPSGGNTESYRELRVEVAVEGARVTARRGYQP